MPTIFVSYSRVDKAFTKRLVERLRRIYGYNSVWYDESLHGGDIWWDEILDQIEKADIFLYLLSNESVTSPYCQAEFEEAQRLRKQLITVQVRDRTTLAGKLRDIQYVDMKAGANDGPSFDLLLASINKQVAQAKKQRPAWKGRTPRPDLSQPEPEPVEREAITTPDLRAAQPREQKSGGISGPVATIIAAVITGLFGLGAAYIAVNGVGDDSQPPSLAELRQTVRAEDALTATAQAAAATMVPATDTEAPPSPTNTEQPSLTPEPPTRTPSPTNTEAPTATLTPSLPEVERVALQGVSSNAEWQNLAGEGGYVREFDGVEMVLVPAGCFDMGSEDGQSDEQPVHEICFEEPFWIDKYEVTNADYGSTGCEQWSSEPDQPRNCVDWFDARAFCEARGNEYDLPTEAEWEYAARGPDSLVYPWGNSYDAALVIGDDDPEYGDTRTAPVGSRLGGASWVGALDLSGNLWEWTSSLYEDYPYSTDHETSNSTNSRVSRGGSFYDATNDLRAANRFRYFPYLGNFVIGLRCARSYN